MKVLPLSVALSVSGVGGERSVALCFVPVLEAVFGFLKAHAGVHSISNKSPRGGTPSYNF